MKISKHIKLILIFAAVLAIFLIPGHAFAANDDVFSDSSKIEVVSQESWPIEDGVNEYNIKLRYTKDFSYTYNGTTYNIEKGSEISAYAVKIDKDSRTLLVPSVGGYYTEGSSAASRKTATSKWASFWGGRFMTLPDQVDAYASITDPQGEVIAAINGDMSSDASGKPNGKLTIEGNVLSNASNSVGAIAVTDSGSYRFTNVTGVSGFDNVMGTWGGIVEGSRSTADVSERDLQARSAIGVKTDGSVVLISISKSTSSYGISLYDLADLLVASDFKVAHNLDGGRSTTLMTRRSGEDISVKSELLYAGGDNDDYDGIYRPRPVSSSLLLVKTTCVRGNKHHWAYDSDGTTVICDRCGDEAPAGTVPEEGETHYDNVASSGTYAVSTEKTEYRSGEAIKAFATSPFTDDAAWVAIYPKGATPRQNMYWEYVSDVAKGFDITGGKSLPAGEYAVSVVANDGYKAQATVYVTITKAGYKLSTDKDTYMSGEPVIVSTEKPDGFDCWVGIYTLGNDNASISFYYIDEYPSNSGYPQNKGNEYDITELTGTLPSGRYKITLSTADDVNNSTAAAVKYIIVKDPNERTSLAVDRIILPGKPVKVSASSNLAGPWVAIYKGQFDESYDFEYGKKYLYYHYLDGDETDVDITEGNYADLKEGYYTIVLFHTEGADQYVVDQYKVIKIGSLLEVNISDKSFIYNGEIQRPQIIATELDDPLTEGKDYDVVWSDASSKDTGDYSVKVTMKGEYASEGPFNFRYFILPKKVDETAKITLSSDNLPYNGKPQRPVITIMDGDRKLAVDWDYDITWSDPYSIVVGKGYKATINFKGNYDGVSIVTYRISAADLSETAVMELSSQSFVYNVKAQIPTVKVKLGSTYLKEGTDYDLEYSDRMSSEVGQYTVTANFMGGYKGEITSTYNIVPKNAENLEIVLDEKYFFYDGTVQHPEVIIRDGNHRLVQDTDYTITIPNSKKVGTYKINIKYQGQYTGSDSVTYKILRKTPTSKELAKAKYSSKVGKIKNFKTVVNASKNKVTISFTKVKGATNYRVAYRKASASKWTYKWTGGKNKYTIKNLKSGGIYQFKVIAFKNDKGTWRKGKYSTVTYRLMSKTKYKFIGAKKAITYKLTKANGATGYQIFYSTKKSMSGKSTLNIKGSAKLSGKIDKLKAGKTYYIQVRPIKTYKGKTYVGEIKVTPVKVKTK